MSGKRTRTIQEVVELRRLYRDGWSLRRLAKKYGLHSETIRKIARGLCYKEVGGFADMRPGGASGLPVGEVIRARNLFRSGRSVVDIAGLYGKSPSHMARILTGRYPIYANIPGAIEALPKGSVPRKPRRKKAPPMKDEDKQPLPSYGQPRPFIAAFANGARIVPGQGEGVLIEKCPVRIPAGRLFSYVTRTVNLPREQSEVGIIHEGKNDIPVRVQKTRKECEAYPLCAVEWGKGDFLVPRFENNL